MQNLPVAPSIAHVATPAVSVAPSPAFWVAITLYIVAAAMMMLVLGRGAKAQPKYAALRRVVLTTVVVAFVAHGFDIGWRGTLGVHPASSVRESIGFLAFIITGGYLLASLRFRLTLGGAVVLPISMLLLLVARLSPVGDDPSVHGSALSTLGRIHISLATLGIGIFALASVLSAIYLVEEKNFKKKRFDTMSFHEAPLEGLDRLAHRLVWAGFPIFTVALALGTVWIAKLDAGWDRPEYGLAVATWVAFAAVLLMRTAYGWRGRRIAKLTLVGFVGALLVLAMYLLRRVF
jgi:ABC-type uncharacterized transport system permease subunit